MRLREPIERFRISKNLPKKVLRHIDLDRTLSEKIEKHAKKPNIINQLERLSLPTNDDFIQSVFLRTILRLRQEGVSIKDSGISFPRLNYGKTPKERLISKAKHFAKFFNAGYVPRKEQLELFLSGKDLDLGDLVLDKLLDLDTPGYLLKKSFLELFSIIKELNEDDTKLFLKTIFLGIKNKINALKLIRYILKIKKEERV